MTKGRPLIVIASANPYKVKELVGFLKGLPVRRTLLREAKRRLAGVEDRSDYEQNAVAKARRAVEASGYMALGEDSGLEVEALGGRPGPFSARFISPDSSPSERNEALLAQLQDVPAPKRTARFVAVVALVKPSGEVVTFRGECSGKIASQQRGTSGFGYDPIFIPDGFEQTFAELGEAVKNRISHRAMAMAKAREYIESLYASENL